MVRPTAAQWQALQPLPVVEVIGQDALAAQDTFTYASVNILPNPSVPILVGAAGGALGMAIVNAQIKAEARRFADLHVQPLRSVLAGFDAKAALGDSLQQALAQQPALFGSYSVAGTVPAGGGPRAVIETSYAMTPDFSALQVMATVTIHAAGADARPLYRNVLVYQSSRLDVPPKTAADSSRMLAEENSRYAALHVDDDIAKANAALANRDPEAVHLRQKIGDEQYQHKQRLRLAAMTAWDPDSRAQRLCEAWSLGHGEALKAAMRASGAEIVHMLELDLADQAPADQAGKPRTVFKNDTREIDYRMGGQMISLAVSDADASLKTPAPTVTVPMPSVSR
ncbi:hypothetical protein [Rhodanobacter sp. B04]|uniref:hypothetical protein n=1 Tax=Rhodanobacter sp. B04 TaxID=1945860 RepID=UPI0020C46A85|nr:hypothetical protein [Rhodanobacter sp. B04]